ncbi:MAG: hypothetical protein DME96_08725 [Verrucomicrobia bacterium]|nr:MAG: hypothetical protein DME96_08725 [Verrucomicrobiota bacterium]
MTAFFVAACVFFYAIPATVGSDREKNNAVTLNIGAFEYAKELIKEGQVIADGRGAWGEHQPSAEAENEFIRLHGFGEYAKWHLGIDDRYAENTKRRYRFPYESDDRHDKEGVCKTLSGAILQVPHFDVQPVKKASMSSGSS